MRSVVWSIQFSFLNQLLSEGFPKPSPVCEIGKGLDHESLNHQSCDCQTLHPVLFYSLPSGNWSTGFSLFWLQEELLTYQRAKMSHVPYVEVTSSRRYYLSEVISPIWHMLRIMLFLMSVLYGVLLVSNGAHRTTGGPVVVTNTTVSVSPLAVLLDKGQTLAEQIL